MNEGLGALSRGCGYISHRGIGKEKPKPHLKEQNGKENQEERDTVFSGTTQKIGALRF